MLLSAYNLFGGRRERGVSPHRAAARDRGASILASPVVGMTHGVVMMAFLR